jgi:Flp pilus assembly pilin Flp
MQGPVVTPRPERPLEEPAAGSSGEAEQPSGPRRGRGGTTTMEYLVMLSFILIVIIATIQSFGISVANLFQGDATAVSNATGR